MLLLYLFSITVLVTTPVELSKKLIWQLREVFKQKGENNLARSSDDYISAQVKFVNFLDFYRFLVNSLDELSSTQTEFSFFDENGKKHGFF